jgi:hypothetical protein
MFARTAFLAVLGAALAAAVARADGLGDDCHRMGWPEPYLSLDRQAAQSPYCAMIAKGWEHQNMLVDQHFDESNTRLSESGRLKVRWILLQTSSLHRVIYIHQAPEPQATAMRMDAVQRLVFQTVSDPLNVPIMVSTLDPIDNPADRIDQVNRNFEKMMPAPVLPKSSGTSGGQDGGSGGTGGPH